MKNERIKTFSKQVWNLMTDDEQNHFYYDVGTIGFVELTSKLLHLELPTKKALDAVLDELTKCDRQSKKDDEMKIGKTYRLTSAQGKPVIYLAETNIKGRAIFLAPELSPLHPFVSWRYNVVDANSIECSNGNYYQTLNEVNQNEQMV